MSSSQPVVEHTTAMALEEKGHLQKSLRRFDMLFFTICALVGLDTLGQVSGFGAQTFAWVVILAVAFVLPYALLMAELGTTFTQEGGPYEWMKMSWGRFAAGVGSVLYWVTNPFWVGGSLAFIATDAWSANLHTIGSGWTIGNITFKLVFIWISIGVAIASLRRGKWIPNVGAIVRVGVLGFFSITVVIYAIEHGVHGFGAGDFVPNDMLIFLGLVPLLLFNYVGFELQNGAAEEMQNPQRDVPVTVIQSGIVDGARLLDPDLRDPRRPPDERDHRHRRLPRRRPYDVRRLRRRPGLHDRPDGAGLHLRAGHVGQRVDDGLGPDPRGRGL